MIGIVDCCARCAHYIQAYSELDFGDCSENYQYVECYMVCEKFEVSDDFKSQEN